MHYVAENPIVVIPWKIHENPVFIYICSRFIKPFLNTFDFTWGFGGGISGPEPAEVTGHDMLERRLRPPRPAKE